MGQYALKGRGGLQAIQYNGKKAAILAWMAEQGLAQALLTWDDGPPIVLTITAGGAVVAPGSFIYAKSVPTVDETDPENPVQGSTLTLFATPAAEFLRLYEPA